MKRFVFLINILVLALLAEAQEVKFEWVKQIGGKNEDAGNSITVDRFGNVYTIGNFESTIFFKSRANKFKLVSTGMTDIFVSKIDSSGNLLWAKKIGGIGFDKGNSIAVDSLGNIYATGYFDNIVDFDPGVGNFNLKSSGGLDIFILKLDASGNFVWAKRMGGTSEDIAHSIKIDKFGNVIITGYSKRLVAKNSTNENNSLPNYNYEILISKLYNTGIIIWTKNLVGTSEGYGYSIGVDAKGDIYTVGSFQGTIDFDPGSDIFDLTSLS